MKTLEKIHLELAKLEKEAKAMVPFQRIHYTQAIEDVRTALNKLNTI